MDIKKLLALAAASGAHAVAEASKPAAPVATEVAKVHAVPIAEALLAEAKAADAEARAKFKATDKGKRMARISVLAGKAKHRALAIVSILGNGRVLCEQARKGANYQGGETILSELRALLNVALEEGDFDTPKRDLPKSLDGFAPRLNAKGKLADGVVAPSAVYAYFMLDAAEKTEARVIAAERSKPQAAAAAA